MNIFNIVLLSLIILISLATLVLSIYYDGFLDGVCYFILGFFIRLIFTPFLALLIQAVLNFYDYLITGNQLGGKLIMYYPITVLLITGLVVSLIGFFVKMSDEGD